VGAFDAVRGLPAAIRSVTIRSVTVRSVTIRSVTVLSAALLTTACATGSPGPASVASADPSAPSDSLPSGFGSLRQEAVSVTLVSGGVQLRITPLDPSVLKLTAPDTETRLMSVLQRAGGSRPGTTALLVSAYTEEPAAPFEPRDLRLDLRGRRLIIEEVHPITPEWGTGQLRQRTPVTAVYRFDGQVRWLEEGPRFGYLSASNDGWTGVLPTLDVERARVRARARGD